MPGPGPAPTLGPGAPPAVPSASLFFNAQFWAGWSQRGARQWTLFLRGHGAGNVGCWAGPGRGISSALGGGPERKAPSPDWNKVAALGAQPGFIDLARCSSHQAGPAPGRLPVFPGVGTPWGNGFSCGHGVGMPPSTWGKPGRWGHAGSGGGRPGDLKSHSQQMSGSWRWGHRLEALRLTTLKSSSLELTLTECSLCARQSLSPHPRRWALQSPPPTVPRLRLCRIEEPVCSHTVMRFCPRLYDPWNQRVLGCGNHSWSTLGGP